MVVHAYKVCDRLGVCMSYCHFLGRSRIGNVVKQCRTRTVPIGGVVVVFVERDYDGKHDCDSVGSST